jgi:glycosyltransferase involved in cell wall biosynthesis
MRISSGGLKTLGQVKNTSVDYPLVSIVTVVFNGEEHLEQTIKSVIGQSYKNLEYIIVDGGSTDNTLQILKQYEDKIDYWISETDKGIYDAMNKGITLSKGDIIGIINSDDWYETDAIEEIVKCYLSDRKCEIFHGLHRLWDNDNIIGIIGHSSNFLATGMISHPSCFVTRDVYKKHGNFDTTFSIAADYELMLRFKSNGANFKFIERVFANFRNNGISNKSRKLILFETNEIKKRYSLISNVDLFIIKLGFRLKNIFG